MASTDNPNRGVDRRSALKKAAAAGAISWVAPAMISESARAQTPGTCTPKCLPLGSGTGLARGSATCDGTGVRRVITFTVNLTGVQTFTCPCGGEPTVSVATCTSNVGNCSVGTDGSITVSGAGRQFTGTLNVSITLTQTASCADRSPEDGDCFASCTTTVAVAIPVADRGNCNGFPNNRLAVSVTTTCS